MEPLVFCRLVSMSTPFREGMIRMSNHTAVAKALVTAAGALAIGLLAIGIGANSSWAGSDQSTPISSEGVFQPAPAPSAPVDHNATGGGSHVHFDRIVDQRYSSKSPLLLAQQRRDGDICDPEAPLQCPHHRCAQTPNSAGNNVCTCVDIGYTCSDNTDCCNSRRCLGGVCG